MVGKERDQEMKTIYIYITIPYVNHFEESEWTYSKILIYAYQ